MQMECQGFRKGSCKRFEELKVSELRDLEESKGLMTSQNSEAKVLRALHF